MGFFSFKIKSVSDPRLQIDARVIVFHSDSCAMDAWVKRFQTIKEGIKSISSGASEIKGDREGRVSVQIDVKL